jgi:DNA-binding transcriptional ArsR family regulator
MADRIRLTAQTLRGIAHPLRVRLLSLLREDGPSTATRLAERTGQSTGATSYHLRQLAMYGFVVEDESRGVGKERWWRAAHRTTSLEAEDAREAPADAEAYMRAVALEYADRVDRWLTELPAMPRQWDEAVTMSHYRLRLRAEEARRMLTELEAVIESYRRDEPDTAPPEDAERVVLQIQLMPFVRTPSQVGAPLTVTRVSGAPAWEQDGTAQDGSAR